MSETLMDTIAMEADIRAVHVAGRVREWFGERSAWLQTELVERAWREDIDLLAWYDHPLLQSAGLRGVMGRKWDGVSAIFFVLDPGRSGP